MEGVVMLALAFLSILVTDTVIMHYRNQASTELPDLQAQK
jgi:hypothetical protein